MSSYRTWFGPCPSRDVVKRREIRSPQQSAGDQLLFEGERTNVNRRVLQE